MGCERTRVRRDIDVLFVRGLSARRWRAVREHLYACPDCRGYYDRVMRLDRALAGDGAALSPAQLALVGGLAVEGVAGPSRPLWRLAAWAGLTDAPGGTGKWALGTVVATALVTALVLAPSPDRHRDDLQARGAAGETGAGVRAVCVGTEPGERPFVRAVLPDGDGGSEAGCRLADTLHFTYANVAPGKGEPFEYLFVFGVDAALVPHWYYPQPDEQESVRLSGPALAEGRLPGGIALSLRHGAGPVRIFALFTHRPVTVEEMARRVEEWRAEGRSLDSLGSVGLEGAAESTFVLPLEE